MIIRIKESRYACTIYDKTEIFPEIAFAGRSNAGKSSLINMLLNRKNLAHTSSQPGKTRNINYFKIDTVELKPFYFVDLPGYGYAKVHKGMKSAWEELAFKYFSENKNLKLIVIVMDVRRDFASEELQMIGLAKDAGASVLVAATKCDKLGSNEKIKRLAFLKKTAGIDVIACSSLTRTGMDDIWSKISVVLS